MRWIRFDTTYIVLHFNKLLTVTSERKWAAVTYNHLINSFRRSLAPPVLRLGQLAASDGCLVMVIVGKRQKLIAGRRSSNKQSRRGTPRGSGSRVLLGPFAADSLRILLVLLVVFRDVCRKRVVGVRRTEKGLDGEEDGADLEGWRPFVCDLKIHEDVDYEVITLSRGQLHFTAVEGAGRGGTRC